MVIDGCDVCSGNGGGGGGEVLGVAETATARLCCLRRGCPS